MKCLDLIVKLQNTFHTGLAGGAFFMNLSLQSSQRFKWPQGIRAVVFGLRRHTMQLSSSWGTVLALAPRVEGPSMADTSKVRLGASDKADEAIQICCNWFFNKTVKLPYFKKKGHSPPFGNICLSVVTHLAKYASPSFVSSIIQIHSFVIWDFSDSSTCLECKCCVTLLTDLTDVTHITVIDIYSFVIYCLTFDWNVSAMSQNWLL